MTRRTVTAITLIILGLIIIGGGFLFWRSRRIGCDPTFTVDFAARQIKFNWYCKGFGPPDETDSWKTYSHEHCGGEEIEGARFSARFHIKLPEDWVAKGVSDEDLNTYYEFTGPQGWFQITCGYGAGGAGCPKYSTIKLKSREVEGCLDEITEDGKKTLALGLAFLDVDTKTGKMFAFDAKLESTPENRTLLDKILASFELE